mmetsp:Transcript_44045/g.71383  ORF Transcript_44045/g.71383 Transcript_44045/m.71383 type:complete len:287 (+) Transcript_44045:108-968(+)
MGGPPNCDGEANPALDNFAICRLVMDGQEWASAEQYYQASKFADADYREAIRAVRPNRKLGARICAGVHGREVWQMGQSQSEEKVENFQKLQVMYVANRVKFEQNPEFRKKLLQTCGPIQAAHSTGDWQLWNSRILERLREELRPASDRDEAKLVPLLQHFARAADFDEARAQFEVEAALRAFRATWCIVVTALDGRSLDVYLSPEDSVLVLKEQLAFQLGISPSRLKLLLGATTLEDTQGIKSAGLGDLSEVTLIISSPVPQDAQVVKARLHELLFEAGVLGQLK